MILFIKRPSFTAIMCATLERRRSSGAVGDLTVLPRLPHFVFTACLSERRTKALFMLLKVLASEWRSWSPYGEKLRCTRIVFHGRRRITLRRNPGVSGA